jgi:hypothetical protein
LRRRKNLHENGDFQKQIYQNDDILRLKIILFLSTTAAGSYKAEIYKRAHLTHWGNFDILNELIKLRWLEQHHLYGNDIFKITDDGRKVTNYVKEIIDNHHHPLNNLDIFKALKDLDF